LIERHSAPATTSSLPAIVVTLVLVAVPTLYFAIDLGRGYPQHNDSYLTLVRSLSYLATGDWLSVHYNFEPVFQKPPLQYMLTAMLFSTGLDPELALRAWPFAFTVGSVLLTGALAGLMSRGRWWVIPSAVALLISSSKLWKFSRSGMLESGQNFFLLLTFCCVLLAEHNRRWWIPAGVAVGLGFLQKTPVALIALAFWLWMQNRQHPDGRFGWAQLKRNRSFRAGCSIALGLCLLWPGIQLVRYGGDFLDTYFVKQMLSRFAPTARIDSSFDGSPFLWLEWLLQDGPQIWVFALALIPTILWLPRFRGNFELRGIAWMILLSILVLTLAQGQLYRRYLQVLLPFLAVTTSIAMAEFFPRRWMTPVVCLALLASSLPGLAAVRDATRHHDRSESMEIGRRFRERLGEAENPMFVDPHRDDSVNRPGRIRQPEFVYYADLDRTILLLHSDRLDRFEREAARLEMSPPYLGVSHILDLPTVSRELGAIEEVDRLGGYAIWRLSELGGHRPAR
jgi:4-amino-4-deoxy-L-arabinose transferase-like glycosyltransferase